MNLREPAAARPPRVTAILEEQAAFWGVSVAEILGRRRRKWRLGWHRDRSEDERTFAIEARQSAMRRCRDEIIIRGRPASFPQIGLWFGRDHTTVMNAYYGPRGARGNRPLRRRPQLALVIDNTHREAA